ncbi:aldehyde dehydrogenase [Heterostelium album PN500]|uniref:Aldehyde dehydrogenase n=1 Tax=Heterostelium pallidum (strain ATCC 26659 / Pp 5 / PN500) TaxID=670386 RepID=D3BKF0_HETP5|nr:aldehyde dehydrogenase [Heterostelium album PN500]EFA78380.1 aldehyde dehydrogenase [Heterostelium album PN500]|eukprot:XP_020430505.1 aldehyde dehydrogenase [Heterostelium album PN500]
MNFNSYYLYLFLLLCTINYSYTKEKELVDGEVIGIELGTTHTRVGIYKNGGVFFFPNIEGYSVTPSFVYFGIKQNFIGPIAKELAKYNPTNTIFNIKSIIGRNFNDPFIQNEIKWLPYKISSKDDKLYVSVMEKKIQKLYTPEEILAMILSKIKNDVESYLGKPIKNAVITCPSYFNDAQRQAMKDTTVLAGLNVLRIINEPTAAALSYYYKDTTSHKKNVLVYHLGVSTLGVSMMSIEKGIFQVLATNGDDSTGGEDYVKRIMKYMLDVFKSKTGTDPILDQLALLRLRNATENAIRELYTSTKSTLEIKYLVDGESLEEILTRTEFENLNSFLFDLTIDSVKKVLEDSNLTKYQVDEVLLVGESSRIQYIKYLLKKFFGYKKIREVENPEKEVAKGVVIQAGILSNSKGTEVIKSVLEVTPWTVIFTIKQLKSKKVLIKVYEGESSMTSLNTFLGQFDLPVIPPESGGVAKVKVNLAVDINGILQVSAEDMECVSSVNYIMIEANKVKLPNTKLFINNQWVDPVEPKQFKTFNPTTEELICEISEGSSKDVDLAVAAARDAFENGAWSKMSATDRGTLLYKLADLIEKNKEWLAALETTEMGKPYAASLHFDLAQAAGCIRYFAGWTDKIQGKLIQSAANNLTAYTRHEPVGVAAFITPWNFPFLIMCWKLGPALASGCTVVAKPSEHTSLTALALCQLIADAGFPPGVFNMVNGYGHTVGDAISRHPDIDKISFTGSTRVGRLVMEASGKSNLKKVTLELGGKSPNIVFDDADLERSVKGAVNAMYINMGQCCCAGSRLFVQEGIYDKFLEKFIPAVQALKVGNPFESNDQGPMASKEHFDRVLNYLAIGKKEGAKVLVGGEKHTDRGYFIQPTVLVDVKDDMCVGTEEIFGPVVCVFKFKTVDEVITRANNSAYGLAAGVWTENISTAHRVEKKLKAGTIWINEYNYIHYLVPFGGYKQSGFGKDLSEYAIQEYCNVKAVILNHGPAL